MEWTAKAKNLATKAATGTKKVAQMAADRAKSSYASTKAAIVDMSDDDCALTSMALGVGSLGLLSGVGPCGLLGTASLVAGVGAVGFGFRGKKAEKETMRKCSIWGTALGSITVSSWLVAQKYWREFV